MCVCHIINKADVCIIWRPTKNKGPLKAGVVQPFRGGGGNREAQRSSKPRDPGMGVCAS